MRSRPTFCRVLEVQRKGVGCVPSETWQMSAIISLMSSSPNSLRCNDDDDLQSRVPTIAINPVTQLLTLAPSRWHGLTLNSRNCSFLSSSDMGLMSSRREWGSDVWKRAWETRTKRNGRLDMSAEECDVCEVMWNTAGPQNNLQEGSRHMTRKHRGHVSGQKARLCWQQRFESIHNSRSSNPLGSVFSPPRLLVLKDGGPHRKSHADAPARSIDGHCWQSEYWGAVFWAVETWWKLSPRKRCGVQIKPTSPYLSQVENLCGLSF